MKIIRSEIFNEFPELIFGFSTKIGLDRPEPFYFNLSLNVGDSPAAVHQNRKEFFEFIGLTYDQIAFQKQVHGDVIKFIDKPGFCGESDAMICIHTGIGLAVSTADCTPVFIYDAENKIIAAIHSGWRSTQKKIVKKTLLNLKHHFNSKPENLFCFVGPSISQKNYEVGGEVAVLFDSNYIKTWKNPDGSFKFFLDVRSANVDMLLEFGIPNKNLEVSSLCSFNEKNLLHSYRRDGNISGRALGVIAMKGKND